MTQLLVIETTYNTVKQLDVTKREPTRQPITSVASLIEDKQNSTCVLPTGNRVTLTESGAVINDQLKFDVSKRNRTGGRLISENVSINIRPLENTKVDELLVRGLVVNHQQ